MRGIKIAVEFLVIAGFCFAETFVSGDISGLWDNTGSPYYIVSDVRVPPEESLLIMPGVQVIFQGHYKFKVDSSAALKAIGAKNEPIIFTAQNSYIGHNGILFYRSSEECSLAQCRIEYGKTNGFFPFSFGGGVLCYVCNPTIMNCEFSNNSAMSGSGGAIACYYSSPIIKNNDIKDNSTLCSGGGIFCFDSNPIIEGNFICQNRTHGSGAGICCSENSSPRISNNIIYSNFADSTGGGIDCSFSSKPIIVNNTIIENLAGQSGGGITCSYNSFPFIVNTTLFGNFAFGDSTEIYTYEFHGYTSGILIAYSSIDFDKCYIGAGSDIIVGAGVRDDISHFADSLFHLEASSPAIDAGTEVFIYRDIVIYAPLYDIEGNSRPTGDNWDIGAYEFDTRTEIEPIVQNNIAVLENIRLSAFPNPFNSGVRCQVSGFREQRIGLEIFDLRGRKIADLTDYRLPITDYRSVVWQPDESIGGGIYFIRATMNGKTITKRIIYLK